MVWILLWKENSGSPQQIEVIIIKYKTMKSIFASKTFWFGIAQIVFGGIGYFTGWVDTGTATGLVITGAGSIGLRFKTTTGVSL